MRTKIFLSFAITGIDRSDVIKISDNLTDIAYALGFTAVNPIKFVPSSLFNSDSENGWRSAMMITYPELLSCNSILVYPKNIQNSNGVTIELLTSIARGYHVIILNEDYSIFKTLDKNDKIKSPIQALHITSNLLRSINPFENKQTF
jgi:hypothetical protein